MNLIAYDALIVFQIAAYEQLQTALHLAAIGIMRMQFIAFGLTYWGEISGVVKQTYIYTSAVRALYKDRLIIAVGNLRLLHQILKATDILHL